MPVAPMLNEYETILQAAYDRVVARKAKERQTKARASAGKASVSSVVSKFGLSKRAIEEKKAKIPKKAKKKEFKTVGGLASWRVYIESER